MIRVKHTALGAQNIYMASKDLASEEKISKVTYIYKMSKRFLDKIEKLGEEWYFKERNRLYKTRKLEIL